MSASAHAHGFIIFLILLFIFLLNVNEKTNIAPADVAENLMQKVANEDVETCFEKLIQDLRSSKEEARMKVEKDKGTRAMKESNGKNLVRKGGNMW
ncbi:hypothetical protein TanjilG_15485 [Lupinus angustifolius]|nr:hypothetical protein TanjilG_15485 [Lupinus angustifolius]